MVSIESGSDDAVPSSVTVNGTLPLFGLTLRFAIGAVFLTAFIQMNRNTIVSYLNDSTPGKLDSDVFHILSIGALPLVLGNTVFGPRYGVNAINVSAGTSEAVVLRHLNIVGLNKDLGSGYNYPVIIERARLTK